VSNSNTNPHLTIKTITTADAGDYICHATNVVGTSASPQSRLTVTGGKLFTIYIRLKIKPNSIRIILLSCQIFVIKRYDKIESKIYLSDGKVLKIQ
jgi:hypothetical protein